jgi:2-amino-4-hydroxy-6-hydroxymethyldihydropteridine diphosphokinase
MNDIVICIGSNTADRAQIIEKTVETLGGMLSNMRKSDVYECESHSGIGNSYFNTVIQGGTTLSYEQLHAATKQMERDMGRTPQSKITGVMPLDIDIVLCNDEVIHPQDYELYHFRHGYEQILSQG